MSWVLPLLTFFLGIIIFIVIVIIKIKGSKAISKLDVIENAPLVEVGKRKRFTNGYSKGILKRQKLCKNGCYRIEFYPYDIEQGEHKPKPDLQAVIVKEEFKKNLAVGDDSDYRQVIKLTDRFKVDLPKKMRNTPEGDEMSKDGQKAFLEATFGKWIRSGDEALHEAVTGTSRIGMTKFSLASIKEENEKLRAIFLAKQTDQQGKDEETTK